MKTKLVPAEMYARMMNMDMSEIARYLEETQYKDEIDALSKDYSGVELIEHATFANLAKTFRKLEEVSIDEPSFLILEYLRRWDVWNIKTLLRGKFQRTGAIRRQEFGIVGECSRQALLLQNGACRGRHSISGRRPAAQVRPKRGRYKKFDHSLQDEQGRHRCSRDTRESHPRRQVAWRAEPHGRSAFRRVPARA